MGEDEFPGLSALGLYAADIRGDGNCLFNALSDQLHGDQRHHSEIRATVIDYMRTNSDYYKQFIDVRNGGATRRQPKRKNVNACSLPTVDAQPTPEEVDRVFEAHLRRMAQGGTYGDNMEIQAFAAAYQKDVKIYQRDFAYFMHGGPSDEPRDTVHIAYHMWEHFSSIRNLNGPHTGLPHVEQRLLSPKEEQLQKDKLARSPVVQPWQIDVVSKSLPYLADKTFIKRVIEECKGSIDNAMSRLLDAEDGGFSSAQESSSVEREADSDDEAMYGPNKRRIQMASKVTTALMKEHNCHELAKVEKNDGSQLSIVGSESGSAWEGLADPLSERRVRKEEDDDSDWREESSQPRTDDEQSSVPPPSTSLIKLKLNMSAFASKPASTRTHVRQTGPQARRRITARDKKDQRKQAQKNLRKVRAQQEAAEHSTKEAPTEDLPIQPAANCNASFTESFRTIAI